MIRPFTDADLTAVMAIADRAWQPIRAMSRAALGDKISDLLCPYGDARSKGEAVKAQALAAPDSFLICEEAGKIVGFISFTLDEKTHIGEILNNAVDPDCGLKGKGQELYAAVLALFRTRGMVAARVVTGLDDAHSPARRAYARAGFDRELQSVTYYQEL